MNQFIKVGSAFLSLLGISNYIKTHAISGSFNINDRVEKPLGRISIVMPSYNEEFFIAHAAQSIKSQNIISAYPDKFEFIVADSHSKDRTVRIAKKYADKIITVPKGKLTARNYVLDYIDNKSEIVVSLDADCYYPVNFLNELLKPFSNKDIIGVSGFTVEDNMPYGPLVNKLYSVAHFLENVAYHKNRLYGRCSAYYTKLQRLEPFNENIDQTNVGLMVQEEEIRFGERLSKYGYITFNPKASCFHFGSAKIGCRAGVQYKSEIDKYYCEQIKNKERF